MISFTIITGTPLQLRNKLEQHGIIHEVTVNEPGGGTATQWVGVHPGLEFVQVPNPIVVTAAVGTPREPGYIPPVMATQSVFLVKFAHEAEAAQTEEPDDPLNTDKGDLMNWTKFGKYIKNNSAPFTFTSADGRTWEGRKINGEQVWLVRSDDFGTWQ